MNRRVLAPPCPRCKSADTEALRNYGRPVKGRYRCLACLRWFGSENPPDAGGTGYPPAVTREGVEKRIRVLDSLPAFTEVADSTDLADLGFCELVAALVSHLKASGKYTGVRDIAKDASIHPSQLFEIISCANRRQAHLVSERTLARICHLGGWKAEDLLSPKALALLEDWRKEHPNKETKP